MILDLPFIIFPGRSTAFSSTFQNPPTKLFFNRDDQEGEQEREKERKKETKGVVVSPHNWHSPSQVNFTFQFIWTILCIVFFMEIHTWQQETGWWWARWCSALFLDRSIAT
ncbi:hypothetical protein NC653_036289 [Populus alba x Populus x berolinensis]|uniref:Uncharacterized protein n=1 Tax=Populus alba x Populus x berolinensis TaxID=444605 RepID=A0AAD6LL09_9ROSI|nr:hypothetical protein NC653_036289 [Populus alba x Populus x berolinensis]